MAKLYIFFNMLILLYVTNFAKQEGNAVKYKVLYFAQWSAILALRPFLVE
jgi:hypothetical protein